MYKNVLESITGVAVYPIASFAIFFLFFLGLLLYVVRANRQHLRDMSEMPLLSDDETRKSTLNHDVLC